MSSNILKLFILFIISANYNLVAKASEHHIEQEDLIEIVSTSILELDSFASYDQIDIVLDSVICELSLLSDENLFKVFAKLLEAFVRSFIQTDSSDVLSQINAVDKLFFQIELYKKYLLFLNRYHIEEAYLAVTSQLSDLRKILDCMQNQEECPICLESIKGDERDFSSEYLMTNCQHIFCTNENCIFHWLLKGSECPTCRQVIKRVKSGRNIVRFLEYIAKNGFLKVDSDFAN